MYILEQKWGKWTIWKEYDKRNEGSVNLLWAICCEKEICEEGVAGAYQVFGKASKERTSQLGQSNRSGSILSPINTDLGERERERERERWKEIQYFPLRKMINIISDTFGENLNLIYLMHCKDKREKRM